MSCDLLFNKARAGSFFVNIRRTCLSILSVVCQLGNGRGSLISVLVLLVGCIHTLLVPQKIAENSTFAHLIIYEQ